ncbi:hypothetical protein GBAR_LOCUS11913 [Geodia barretti]|uniref:Uncharacterized protein n=1 Tax=Geodia barretti TaxID=519541 RepID=A0AA35WJY4_GEOBA|nr:hypothetical protein GBAR_LOCUS11913 [Geodia barretti]
MASISAFRLLATLLLLSQTSARRCPPRHKFINGSCYNRCSVVCPNVDLPCEPFLEASLSTGDLSSWIAAENAPCFQREFDQITGAKFLRTSCRCPERIYTNTSNPGSLSNCILSEITEENLEINFGRLSQVQLGVVRASGEDIDFQGDTRRNMICVVDTAEDVEFGTMTKFSYNIINTMIIGDDLQFEPGVVVGPYNVFKSISIHDEFSFVDDEPSEEVRVIRNYWNTVRMGECDIESEIQPLVIGNVCNAVTVDDTSSCLIPPLLGGFSCLNEADNNED